MSKPMPKVMVGTPTQLKLLSGNTCQTRSIMAGNTADRIAEQSSQQKTTARTRDSHSNSSADAAVKAPVNEEATSPASSLHKIADTLSHII